MPPNMSTAVFDTTSARVRPPAWLAAQATSDEQESPSSTASTLERSAANALLPAGVTGLLPATPVTASTIASYQPRIVAVFVPSRPNAWAATVAANGPAR